MYRRIALIAAVGALACLAAPARAQGIIGKIKQRASSEVDRKEDEAVEKVAAAIACAVTDKACIKKAHDAGKPIKVTDASGKPVSSADSAAAISAAVAQAAGEASSDPASATPAAPAATAAAAPDAGAPPGAGAWLNYDFVPGDRTIFYEDFSGNDVGDFPRRLKLDDGNFEVVDIKGQKMLRTAEGGVVYVVLPEKLPPRFTIEAVYHSPTEGNPLFLYTGGNSNKVGCYMTSAFVDAESHSGSTAYKEKPPGFVTCRFTIDTKYVRAYLDSMRTANVPEADIVRSDTLYIQMPGGEDNDPTLLASIRVAEGGKKLYDLISTKGRASTQGILFDVGSDHIRGESTPTLSEIGDMLKTHPTLKLTIEGHTDNVGSAAANQTLSEKRAAAVKSYLVSTYGIDAARLKSAGFGATKPVSPNTTAEGRQNNRRVELVKTA